MQVVSGRIGKETVHFEAPPQAILFDEIEQFISWFNLSRSDSFLDPLLRAAIVHFGLSLCTPLRMVTGASLGRLLIWHYHRQIVKVFTFMRCQ